jgi:hypothetical protein
MTTTMTTGVKVATHETRTNSRIRPHKKKRSRKHLFWGNLAAGQQVNRRRKFSGMMGRAPIDEDDVVGVTGMVNSGGGSGGAGGGGTGIVNSGGSGGAGGGVVDRIVTSGAVALALEEVNWHRSAWWYRR